MIMGDKEAEWKAEGSLLHICDNLNWSTGWNNYLSLAVSLLIVANLPADGACCLLTLRGIRKSQGHVSLVCTGDPFSMM
jgi:hypothetical protein